ncbi:unnamed protein product [Cuscuta campestris]|uniref:Tf2-1-like SH3-like domain-containing protein n=1 Tax=Cuscuta campestris TaxID=132261 RepID=A0A484K997_9ASTE|nr:unnamed protein product [Cuscuta campestris]
MASNPITAADFQEFQKQIDVQMLSHTSAMQTLNHNVEQLQCQVESVLARSAGLCYNCDEKWVKGHRCGRFLLLLEDDDEEELPLAITNDTLLTADVSSLHSMAGVSTPRSLRLSSMISEVIVDVLIDGGSTHNFIHPSVVEKLHLLVTDVLPSAFMLGTAHHYCVNNAAPREFLIRTDQRSLRELLHQVIQTPDQQFYVRKLLGYRFKIEYKPGWTNCVADALSRQEDSGTTTAFLALSQPLPDILEQIRAENSTQPDLLHLHQAHQRGTLRPPFTVVDGLLLYNTRLCIGAESPLRQAVYGRPPPDLIPYRRGASRVPAVDEVLAERDELLRMLRANLEAAQQRMKAHADSHRRDVAFKVGDLVLLKLQPYRQHSVARRTCQKLSLRYYGPFEILERIGEVAYRLKLPLSSRIHPVFHVAVLKPYKGPSADLTPLPLPEELVGGRVPSRPVSIHASRRVLHAGHPVDQVLVRWSDGTLDDATWEPADQIRCQFPDLDLEDKVVPQAVGNVTEAQPPERKSTRVRRRPGWQREYEME